MYDTESAFLRTFTPGFLGRNMEAEEQQLEGNPHPPQYPVAIDSVLRIVLEKKEQGVSEEEIIDAALKYPH